jgi:WD40 repeat protein
VNSHVFISYSREDLRYVMRLVDYLTAAGVQVWLDKDIPTGDRWDAVIRKKIETAAAVIVVMSPMADESMWVTNEIHHALAIRKPILPLLLEGQQFFTLMRIHHEDVTDGRMPGESFMAALSELLNTPPASPGDRNSIFHRVHRYRVSIAIVSIVVVVAIAVIVIQSWAGNSSALRPTEPASDTPITSISTAGATVDAIAFSPDGKILATGGGNDHTVRLWDVTTGQLLRPLIGDGVATAVAFSPDGKTVVSNGDLAMWDPATGEKAKEINDSGWAVAFSPDGRTLAVGGIANTVRLWTPSTGKLVNSLTLTNDPGDVVECLAFRPDGKILAAGDYKGTIQLWNPSTGARVRTLTNPDGAYWMSFSPDGTLFVANGDGPVRSWNTATGAQVATLAEATTAALSPDGTLLATAGKTDYSVRLWDSATGELRDTFVGHANAVRAIAFSNDGKFLATGGDDQTVRLWKVAT